MANFPLTKPALGTYTDNVDYPQAAHVNNVNREVDAIGGVMTPGIHITGMKLTWNSATSIDVGIGACACQNADIVVSTSAITKSSLSLSASTMYHVYVYLSGGSPAAEVVTTAPVAWSAGAYSKTGDTSRRYVGSVLTDGSSNVYRFVHVPSAGMMTYVDVDQTTTPFRVLAAGTSSTAAAVSLSGCSPATATAAMLQAVNTADQIMRIGGTSGTAATAFVVFLVAGNSATQSIVATVPIVASQQIYYKFDAAVGGGTGIIDLYGYLFDR